jgi:hypothetical protein
VPYVKPSRYDFNVTLTRRWCNPNTSWFIVRWLTLSVKMTVYRRKRNVNRKNYVRAHNFRCFASNTLARVILVASTSQTTRSFQRQSTLCSVTQDAAINEEIEVALMRGPHGMYLRPNLGYFPTDEETGFVGQRVSLTLLLSVAIESNYAKLSILCYRLWIRHKRALF